MSDYAVELTTKIEPAKKFKIDDQEFELLGFEHLSDKDESKVTAAFARHGRLAQALVDAKTEAASEKIADKLRDSRITLISMLTTAPKEVIEDLPLPAQAQLLEVIQQVVGAEGDDVIPD